MRIIDICGVLLAAHVVGCADGSIGDRPATPEPFGSGGSSFGGDPPLPPGAGGSAFPGLGTYDLPLVVATRPPPPLSGGTLLVFDKGHKAAVADPDRDQVVIVDLDQLAVTSTIALQKGDEPGRLVQDGAGSIHVVLRSAGAIASIDPSAGALARRDAVCASPRGIAYDGASDSLLVACAEGRLVTLSAKDGQPTRTVDLPRDLRDVVIDGDHLLISRFRSAELLVVDASGALVSTIRPPPLQSDPAAQLTPAVAWRMMAAPGGGALMVHQQEVVSEVQIRPGGYAGTGCGGGIVQTAVSYLRSDGTGWTKTVASALAIDMAISDGAAPVVYVPSAGTRADAPVKSPIAQLIAVDVSVLAPPATGSPEGGPLPPGVCVPEGTNMPGAPGQIVALGVDALGQPILQTREPFALVVGGKSVALPGESRKDTGHDLFHLATSAGIACASCHPEGHEDGHVWNFAGLGARRTQSIAGGILGTEPFHWNGDMTDFLTLAHHVFNERMLGPSLQDDYVAALAKWIDAIPPSKSGPLANSVAAERGRAVFNSADAACATCHAGTKLTNNITVDVGTGGAFQVPSLRGVAWRAPFMHDGCAKTLADRFDACGGSKHGHVPLDGTTRADLIVYLETL